MKTQSLEIQLVVTIDFKATVLRLMLELTLEKFLITEGSTELGYQILAPLNRVQVNISLQSKMILLVIRTLHLLREKTR